MIKTGARTATRTPLSDALGQQGAPAADPRESWHSPLGTGVGRPEYFGRVPGMLPGWLASTRERFAAKSETGMSATWGMAEPTSAADACGAYDAIGGGVYHVWEDGKCVKKLSDIHGRTIEPASPTPTRHKAQMVARRDTRNRTFLMGAGVALGAILLLRGVLK